MIKNVLTIAFISVAAPIATTYVPLPAQPIQPIKAEPIRQDPLINALIMVESSGNDSAYNAMEDAVGCLQIRPIMVREVNRILRKQDDPRRFKMKDRWDRDKSLEMFDIWQAFHHSNSDHEKIARNWNGGPKGWKKESTAYYWEKVQKHLEVN